MTDRTHPDSGRATGGIVEMLHARIANLEQELAHTDSLLGKANALARIRGHRIAELEALLSSPGFTAEDMATAAAQGFRDGVASVAASAGGEPVATIKSWTNGSYWRNYKVEWHRNDLPEGAHLYTHPSPPEGMVGGWIASQDQMPPPTTAAGSGKGE